MRSNEQYIPLFFFLYLQRIFLTTWCGGCILLGLTNYTTGVIMNKVLRLRIVEMFDNQANFAHELGVHESAVSQIVNERRKLSHRNQDRWASLLGATPEALGWGIK